MVLNWKGCGEGLHFLIAQGVYEVCSLLQEHWITDLKEELEFQVAGSLCISCNSFEFPFDSFLCFI
jgi:hypothetical protein